MRVARRAPPRHPGPAPQRKNRRFYLFPFAAAPAPPLAWRLSYGDFMKHLAFVLALSAVAPALAAEIPVDSPRWQFEGAESRVVEHEGRRALFLSGANAQLADAAFDTGVIEFDMFLPSNAPSFPGVIFRGQGAGDYEHVYWRPHQNGNPDALQYTPFINGMTGWQIYSEHNAQTRFPIGQWFRARLEVGNDAARLLIDGAPVLVVGDLKRDREAGFITLKGSLGGAYYSNINIESGAPRIPNTAAQAEELPPGLVQSWRVSPAMAEADAFALAAANRLDQVEWSALAPETSGIANLSRIAAVTPETPTTLARLSLRASRAGPVQMRFGFSDRVQIYLNGALLYAGDDSQSSRDYRFLGTVGLYDTLYLPLRRGQNEIVFAVSEGGGGWAATAAFPDMTTITLID